MALDAGQTFAAPKLLSAIILAKALDTVLLSVYLLFLNKCYFVQSQMQKMPFKFENAIYSTVPVVNMHTDTNP